MSSIIIKNGNIINPDNKKNPEQIADILIQGNKIKKIGKNLKLKADKIINAKGKIVTAGLIDMHVHLREPGQENKETIETATQAAAKGGFTTILGMPNTTPPIDSKEGVRFVLAKAKKVGIINVLTAACLTKGQAGEKLTNIKELKRSGATMLIDDGPVEQNITLQKLALKQCRSAKMPIMAHAEDAKLKDDGVMHEGWVSTQLGLRGIPASVETLVVEQSIELLRKTPTPYHFTHISAAGTVELVRQAKKEGLPVTCDTTPHHIALTDEACLGYNTLAKVAPPIRSEEHRQALLEGLKDGTIDTIASDHAPHTLVDKYAPFAEATNGLIGLETFFPVCYTELVGKKILTLSDLIKKLTLTPAKIMRIKKGRLQVGEVADISILDIKTKRKIDKNKFKSKGRNTPFHGKVCQGFATETIVGGRLVLEKGRLTE